MDHKDDERLKEVNAINKVIVNMVKTQEVLISQLRVTMVVIAVCFTIIICTMIAGFFWYESQFDVTETTETALSTEGDNANINSVTNGNMYNDGAIHNDNRGENDLWQKRP